MKKNLLLYKLAFGFVYFFGMPPASAQQNKLERKNFLNDFVFKGNHIQLNISMLAATKAKLKNQTGSHPVTTRTGLGLLLSLKYKLNFNNYYSLVTGAEAIMLGRNFITSFDKNDFSPPLVQDYKIEGDSRVLVISLPVLIEKRWLYANTKFFFADAGFRLNASTGGDLDFSFIFLPHTNNGYYNAGGTVLNANNEAKPWISFPINAGHSWLLKNNNLLQLTICSNISFTKYVNGTYQIIIPGKPLTEGKYSSTGSFVGLSLNYIFTNANYRIRKAHEKR